MEWKIFIASVIAAVLVTYVYFDLTAKNTLTTLDDNDYTMYFTYGTSTVTLIKYAPEKYFIISGTTSIGVTGKYAATVYRVVNSTTEESIFYVTRPFDECNIADPLLRGTIMYMTNTKTTTILDPRYVYVNGCYIFPRVIGIMTVTATIGDGTIIMSDPARSFYLTIIGKKK